MKLTTVIEQGLSGVDRKEKNTFKVRGEVYRAQSSPVSSLSATTDLLENCPPGNKPQ